MMDGGSFLLRKQDVSSTGKKANLKQPPKEATERSINGWMFVRVDVKLLNKSQKMGCMRRKGALMNTGRIIRRSHAAQFFDTSLHMQKHVRDFSLAS